LQTTILIGNEFTRHKQFFKPLHINTFSIWGRGWGIFAIFQDFCDFFKLKIYENV